jgi:hypothetical protein
VFDRPWQIVAEALDKEARIPNRVQIPATQVAGDLDLVAAVVVREAHMEWLMHVTDPGT